MLVMLLLGWVVVLPALVVGVLCVGSRRRARRPEAVDLEAIRAFAARSRPTSATGEPAPQVRAGSTGY